jgi:alpha-beta hydrolase superfamily lysophospholipase
MTGPLTVLPEDLEPTFRGFLKGHGETPIAFCRWEHPAPAGRVVISHGYGEHAERYRHVAHWLHGLGWSVSAMDHQGFGRSGGVRGDARSIQAFVEDLALFLRHERHHDADRQGARPRLVDGVPMPPLPVCPQVLLGHSFGGLVALLCLLWHADTLDGLVLSSPVLALRELGPFLRVAQRILGWVAPHRPLDLPNDKNQVCSDPVLVQRYWADPLCHRFITAAFVRALRQGREEVLHLGAELDRPILLLEAGEDTVVDPDGAEPLWGAVRPGLLERHRLPGFRHEVLHDLRRGEAFALVQTWLAELKNAWERNFRPSAVMFE